MKEKEIVFVTTNLGKIASAQEALKGIKVIPLNAELIEPRSDDIRIIAEEKVKQAYILTGKPCIALDAGFYINEWNGFPRAYVNPALETLGLKGILKLMEGIENRDCEFRQCLAYNDGEKVRLFESSARGKLSEKIEGQDNKTKWSELSYIFRPLDFKRTLAQFDEKDTVKYNSISEPSSIKKFGDWYNLNNNFNYI